MLWVHFVGDSAGHAASAVGEPVGTDVSSFANRQSLQLFIVYITDDECTC